MVKRHLAGVVSLGVAFLLNPGGAAQAHAIVMASQPAANQVVPLGALPVSIKFNSRIDVARSRLLLVPPSGKAVAVAAETQGSPTGLNGHAELTVPGNWALRWQVLSIDGHITRGEIPFIVRDQSLFK